jgi:hypothetical protein
MSDAAQSIGALGCPQWFRFLLFSFGIVIVISADFDIGSGTH